MQSEDDQDAEHALQEFVMNCPELAVLEDELSKFNLFSALRLYKKEWVASAFLRWLLDPAESHGLESLFGDRFLKKVLSSPEARELTSLTPAEIDVLDLSDALVRSEESDETKRRTDISFTSRQSRLRLLIENKLFSGEHPDQTVKYAEGSKKTYPNFRHVFVYLTRGGERASSAEFIRFSYRDLTALLKEILSGRGEEVNPPARALIEQFVHNAEVNLVEESRIDELCRRIYQKHRKALDRIYESLPEGTEVYRQFGEKVSSALGPKWTHRETNSYCQIYQPPWKEWFPPKSGDSPFIHYEVWGYDKRFGTAFHVEKESGEDIREQFLGLLPVEHNTVRFNKTAAQVVSRGPSKSPFDWDDTAELAEMSEKVTEWIKKTADFVEQTASKLRPKPQESIT